LIKFYIALKERKMKAKKRTSLIPLLQEIQRRDGYISKEGIKEIAEKTGASINEIYGIASFYTQFRFTHPAKHCVNVCLGTACHVKGGMDVLEAFERELKIKVGERTSDGEFELQRVACVGCCALAPVVVVDDEVHPKNSPGKIKEIIEKYKGKNA